MRANFVEILSRIRLNLTNVEQFIGTACSLADDNPAISRDIHQAAAEIRSSALLIDHLRSLFAHQQTIDWRQQLICGRPLGTQQGGGGGGVSSSSQSSSNVRGGQVDNLGYFSYANKQTLIKAAKCLVANTAKILYLTDEIVLRAHQDRPSQQQQQQQQQEAQHQEEEEQQQQQQQLQQPYGSSLGQKLQAPVSGPTHSSLGYVFEPAGAPSDNLTTSRCHQDGAEGKPNLSDRLDNVANYSQLLRSFGEFSVDLIDLGNCIMLARHLGSNGSTRACPCVGQAGVQSAGQRLGANPATSERAATGPEPFMAHTKFGDQHQQPTAGALDYYRPAPSDRVALGRLDSQNNQIGTTATTTTQTTASHLHQQQQQQHHHRLMLAHQQGIRPSSSSYSMSMPMSMSMAAGLTGEGRLNHLAPNELSSASGRRDSLGQPQRQLANNYYRPRETPGACSQAAASNFAAESADKRLHLEQEEEGEEEAAAAAAAERDEEENGAFSLASNKMGCGNGDDFCQLRSQIRDIQILFQVNRSILLLLSASKCCLRLGSERSKGFEARRLIGVQIRVSISIIMALVKCSVFNDQQQQQQTQPAPVMGRHLVNGGSSGGLASLTGAAFNRPKAGECTIRRNSQNYGPAAGEQYFECANIGPNSKPEVSPTLVKWLDGRQRLGGGTESPLNESAELHQLMRAALDDVDPVGGSQDGQRQQHNNNWELAAIQGRTTGGGGSPPPLAQLTAINDANWQQCQRQDRHGQGSRSLLAPDNDKPRILRALGDNKHEAHDEASRPSFVATSASQQQQSRQKCSNGSKNKPLDIMGHFLVTLGGTLSAHDSIQGLQALVEPFTSVRNQDQLAASLDHVLALTSNGIDSCRLWASYGHRNTIHDHSQPLNQPPSTNTQRHQAGAVQANTIHHDQENLATGFGKEEEPIQPLAIGERADHRHHHHQTTPSSAALCGGGGQLNKSHDQANGGGSAGARKYPPVALMNKRQLVGALNFVFLGELKQNLVERLHEFTDCAYTKHEHRETILSLLTSIKFILNKFVKLIYRLRRRIASPSEPNQLSNLRQFARQLGDFCGQLSYELQMAAIELADELDRLNGELELTKQMKHLCLVGDTTKARLVFDQFCEQSEQLVEICRMLNQIAPTNKLKITTKSLANWFQLNYRQLVAFADCLSENPISKTAKDCVWTYIQVWSSFYDDFGQLSRQLAYLAHSKSDPRRAGRVSNLRDQIDSARVNYIMRLPPLDDHLGQDTNQRRQQQQLMLADGPYQQQQANSDEGRHQQRRRCSQNEPELEFEWAERPGDWPRSPLQSIGSLQSLGHNQQFAFEMTGQPSNDSPRSLDHYHGFGPNYRRWHEGQPAAGGCPNSECSPVSPVSKFVIDNQQQQLLGSGACEPCAAGGGYSSASSRQQQVASCDSSLSSLAATERQYLMGTVTPLSQIEAMTQQHWAMVAQENEPSLALAQTTPAVPSSLMGTVTPSYSSPFGSSMTPLAPTSIRVDPLAPPIEPPSVPARRSTTSAISGTTMNAGTTSTGGDLATSNRPLTSALERPAASSLVEERRRRQQRPGSGGSSGGHQYPVSVGGGGHNSRRTAANIQRRATGRTTLGSSIGREDQVREEDEENYEERAVAEAEADSRIETTAATARCLDSGANVVLPPGGDQNSIASSTLDCAQTGSDKWSDSEADAIVRGARETAQMALSMYQFTRGEGDLNTTQDLFTQAELFAEEANELYKEVRCFSYKVPAGDLKKELLFQLSTIPALVQQLQFTVKNPTVGKAATFAKVDSVIRETKSLMEAVNRVVEATLSCRQHYNMASASLRKRTRTLSPAYRGDKFEFEPFGSPGGGRGLGGAFGGSGGGGGRHASSASGGMGSEPDI